MLAKRIYRIVNEFGNLVICCEIEDNKEQVDNIVRKLKDEHDIEVEFKRHRQKRSVDANAYLWVLCDKIAKELKSSKEDIYRKYIKEYGECTPIPIKAVAVNDFIKGWQQGGTGWIAEVVDDSKLKGYKLVHVYYGSSTYNTEQMSRLINGVVEDAKELGIETKTPEEIREIEEMWEKRYG